MAWDQFFITKSREVNEDGKRHKTPNTEHIKSVGGGENEQKQQKDIEWKNT